MAQRFHLIQCLAFAFLALIAFGCGGRSGPVVQSEEQKIRDAVSTTPDMLTDAEAAKKHFAAGNLPDKATCDKIVEATLIPLKTTIQGEQATVSISVRKDGETELGQVDWVLVKELDQWKIQSAPMP